MFDSGGGVQDFNYEHPGNPVTVEIHTGILFRMLSLGNNLMDMTAMIRNGALAPVREFRHVFPHE